MCVYNTLTTTQYFLSFQNISESGEKYFEKESLRSATDIAKEKALTPHSGGGTISSLWRTSKHGTERSVSKESEREEPMSKLLFQPLQNNLFVTVKFECAYILQYFKM